MSDARTAPLAVGLLCPYDLDVPGGVREQVLGLAGALARAGHVVEVMGPRSGGTSEVEAPDGVVVRDAGRVVPVPGNGSTARLALGPGARVEAARWAADSGFDVVHVHEPVPPGIGHAVLRRLARLGGDRPAVAATVHVSLAPAPAGRSRALRGAARHVGSVLRGVDVLSAVSEHARRTVVDHLGRSPVVVPNGVDVTGWAATPRLAVGAPTAVVVGRAAEPRKGVDVLLAAWPQVRLLVPDARLVVVGPTGGAAPPAPPGVRFAGVLDEAAKRRLVASADVLVAPHRGGESFGLVLVEAMAVGTRVVASDLPAFRDVLAGTGVLVPPGCPTSLAGAVADALGRGRADAGPAVDLARRRATDFDWSAVATRWERLYDLAVGLDGGRGADAVLLRELQLRARTVLDATARRRGQEPDRDHDHDNDPGPVRRLAAAAAVALETAAGAEGHGSAAPAVLAAHNRLSVLARDPSLPAVLRLEAAGATARLHAVRLVVNDLARREGRHLVELDDVPPAPPPQPAGTGRAPVPPQQRTSA